MRFDLLGINRKGLCISFYDFDLYFLPLFFIIAARVEDYLYEKLELRKENRMNNLELLGQAMTEAGNEFSAGTAYGIHIFVLSVYVATSLKCLGSALLKVGATQYRLGAAERDFLQTSAANVLTPLKRFLEGDMKTIAKERKILMNKRLDLDACKNRLRKARSVEGQAHAEADLRVAQSEFDKQSEILKLLLEGIQTAHNNHLKCLRDFAEAQMTFYAQCHQHMADLQRELSGAQEVRAEASSDLSHNHSLRKNDEENDDIDDVVICINGDF
uniref:BAR domain-containing protein n=1 Tax=Romanomermis culicivorax TaxID=13658 RepID=A0A915JI25_ROMCU